MENTDKLAEELKKIYWDAGLSDKGFNDMAKHVQSLILRARIDEHSIFCERCLDHIAKHLICDGMKELQSQLKELSK